MSLPSVKWIPGAPKQLKVGMVLKSGKEVNLIGSSDIFVDTFENNYASGDGSLEMRSGNPIESHGQLVDAYVLEWLGNDGIVKGVSR
ncbi:MAG: hypothetical protein J6D44_17480 [Pseudomonas sp.]|nr:hypothetical protein [Pseudomonas sp.]